MDKKIFLYLYFKNTFNVNLLFSNYMRKQFTECKCSELEITTESEFLPVFLKRKVAKLNFWPIDLSCLNTKKTYSTRR